jgi:hypothetical protein
MQPKYEIYKSQFSSFYVVRLIEDQAKVVDRFEERQVAEHFITFLNLVDDARRRLVSH